MKTNLLACVVLVCSLLTVTPAAAATAWQVDLSRTAASSTNVATGAGGRLGSAANQAASADPGLRTGFAVYPHRLAAPANAFTAEVRSSVPAGAELAVDVRGRSGDAWSEWVEIRPGQPGVLPEPVTDIEVRAVLSAPLDVPSPTLTGLSVVPATVPGGRVRSTSVGLSYSVFATREGLVGRTTANGHRVAARDHFVALPSWRGLSGRDTGDYSVRVCAANGRCAWAPVWDVGPWNTRDDYWAEAGQRQEWHDLPPGKPEAQAAHQDGYNGGKDQFGRRVANPAGIDLADGTFWDGLKLKTNAWVTVTYEWTGANPAGYVNTPGDALNVRTAPNSQAAIVGIAGNHAQVRIECAVAGEQVAGSEGTTNSWYRLAAGMFVSAAYVSGPRTATAC
ncbi:hypothetical protein [Actinophytocola sp.]|uniref:hypothetical protein n=1 Tax=Actinophytocola sp. TaxID=1872138 RepID=UPI00389ABD97